MTADRAFPLVTLPTERLVLRPFERGDAADVHAVWCDQAYLRFAPAQFPHAGAGFDRASASRASCATRPGPARAAAGGFAGPAGVWGVNALAAGLAYLLMAAIEPRLRRA